MAVAPETFSTAPGTITKATIRAAKRNSPLRTKASTGGGAYGSTTPFYRFYDRGTGVFSFHESHWQHT